MKFKDFKISEEDLMERKSSDAKRYLSELGVFLAMPGVLDDDFKIEEVELEHIGDYINESKVADLSRIQSEIKRENILKHIKQHGNKLIEWYYKTKQFILPKIDSAHLPERFAWVAGENQAEGPVDVVFKGSSHSGIYVKDEGGITLKSPGMEWFGIPAILDKVEGPDGKFKQLKGERVGNLSPDTYSAWMANCMKAVMDIAKSKEVNGRYVSFSGGQQVIIPGDINQPIPGSDDPTVPRDTIRWLPQEGKFFIRGKGSKTEQHTMTEQEILKATVDRDPTRMNRNYNRVFGNWYTEVGAKNNDPFMKPFSVAVAKILKQRIEDVLGNDRKTKSLLQMDDKPYYYVSTKDVYEVPTAESIGKLIASVSPLKAVKQESGVNFMAYFVTEDAEDKSVKAQVEIRFRWRNGLFATNSTIGIQSLKNAEVIGWIRKD